MVNRISDRSAAGGAGLGETAARAGTGSRNGNGPRRDRSARTFPMNVRRIATPDKPHPEYSTRSREVARARQGLELGEGGSRWESAQVGSGPEQDPLRGRESPGRAQDGDDRFGGLDPLRPPVHQAQPQAQRLRERRVLQQVEPGAPPYAVQAQTGETLQPRDAGIQSADVGSVEVQAQGDPHATSHHLPE